MNCTSLVSDDQVNLDLRAIKQVCCFLLLFSLLFLLLLNSCNHICHSQHMLVIVVVIERKQLKTFLEAIFKLSGHCTFIAVLCMFHNLTT